MTCILADWDAISLGRFALGRHDLWDVRYPVRT
jgi:hypothetical protein